MTSDGPETSAPAPEQAATAPESAGAAAIERTALAAQPEAAPAEVTAELNAAVVLLIDDSENDRELVMRELRKVAAHVGITEVKDLGELDRAVEAGAFNIAVTDYQLRWSNGLEVLKRLKAKYPTRPVIMFTASGSEDVAVAAMKQGLDDYVTKTVKHYPRLPYTAATVLQRARARQQLQEAREAHRRELELEIRRKNDFLATLAHELRNPLAPIRYSARLIEPDAAPEVLRQARQIIERQAVQMGRLLDDLLDVSRITRDMIELRREIVDVRHVVEDAVTASRPVIESMRHELHVDISGDPLWVDADVIRLSQVVTNVLENAVKYTDPEGRIAISVRSAPNVAQIVISDNGIGIPPEAINSVFEPFSRARPGDPKRGGLGIGLAVVRKLVELHGGTVTASSDGEGTGSEFVVSLPTVVAPPTVRSEVMAVAADDHPNQTTSTTIRVLLVDDNPDVVDSLAVFLASEGRSVHVAYDGLDAMRLAELLRPDVIVLDLGMPHLDGYELTRWIRQQSWGTLAKVFAVTGWGQEQDRQKTREAGVDQHLVKPVHPDVLAKLIDAAHMEIAEGAPQPHG